MKYLLVWKIIGWTWEREDHEVKEFNDDLDLYSYIEDQSHSEHGSSKECSYIYKAEEIKDVSNLYLKYKQKYGAE